MYFVTVCLCLVGYVFTAPINDTVPLEKQQLTVIPIVSQSEELEPNGTYKYSYETGNGIKREEISYDKIVPKAKSRAADSNEGGESDESDEIHVQQGSYSYTAPDGTVITVRYIADENGFQPIGDHIPRVVASVQNSLNSVSVKHSIVSQTVDNSEAGSSVVAAKSISETPLVKSAASEKSQPKLELRAGSAGSESSSVEDKSSVSSIVATEDISTTEASSEPTTIEVTNDELSTTEASTTTVSEELSSTTELSSSTDVIITETNGKESTVAHVDEVKSTELPSTLNPIESESSSSSPNPPNPVA